MTDTVPVLARPQRATLVLRIGRKGRLKADVAVTPAGLAAIGVMVSAILLSSAAIVAAARRPVD